MMKMTNMAKEFDYMTEIVTWPDIQEYMDKPGFREHTALINSELGIEIYGSSAYRMDPEWKSKVDRCEITIEDSIPMEFEEDINVDWTFPEIKMNIKLSC